MLIVFAPRTQSNRSVSSVIPTAKPASDVRKPRRRIRHNYQIKHKGRQAFRPTALRAVGILLPGTGLNRARLRREGKLNGCITQWHGDHLVFGTFCFTLFIRRVLTKECYPHTANTHPALRIGKSSARHLPVSPFIHVETGTGPYVFMDLLGIEPRSANADPMDRQ